ncbi:hypothetical protein CVO_07665 [Sulfurimonas sp. CVO]|uniref:Lipoprotein n=1 Tax=Sulfurimonas xiamenensis TaxID=2590021 RepID=A0AAJ4A5E6_9BACT|nr:MAG: hypothetical protein C0628_07520 [Sulfurimonas sp.]QFR44192.1 hypothetical protein FJR47_01735 [Sulfurimonas xiamenensis]QHG92169.1 hypothetical protein CVO_07665 [Sulfurimonas sp. CVO]
MYNLTSVFHLIIIAIFLLSISGCGYKADPYYLEDAPQSDENIEFIIKKSNNNESSGENR